VAHIKADLEVLHVNEVEAGPMEMIALHTHERHADAFYVLEGEIEIATSATERVRVGAGGFAVAPPGVLHALGVPERARYLNIHAPGMAFAEYLRGQREYGERGERPPPEFFERFDVHYPT
jgi:mannose-6-phosphate isomerase-like protein (cupin superfamily)